jgi:hypothetical protein
VPEIAHEGDAGIVHIAADGSALLGLFGGKIKDISSLKRRLTCGALSLSNGGGFMLN